MRNIKVLQLSQPRQRREVGNALIRLQFEIFKLRAGGQGRKVGKFVHCEHRNLKLRHVLDKGQIPEALVVADVEILHIRAVLQNLRVPVVQLAARRGLGGENLLHVRARGVISPKPHAPHHLGVRQRVTDGGHILIGDTAAVHVEIAEILHALRDAPYQRPTVIYFNVVQIHLIVEQGKFFAIEREAEIKIDLRTGGDQRGHVTEAERGAVGTAKLHRLQRGQIGEHREHLA